MFLAFKQLRWGIYSRGPTTVGEAVQILGGISNIGEATPDNNNTTHIFCLKSLLLICSGETIIVLLFCVCYFHKCLLTWSTNTRCNFSLKPGVARREKRQAKYHHDVVLQADRKFERNIYCTHLFRYDFPAILTLVWYIQSNLIQSDQAPSNVTLSQMKKLIPFQRDVATQTLIVYNDRYRDTNSRKFVISDCKDKHLNGRVG